MKVGIITPAYNEERFIGACIDQFRGFEVEHLVLVSKKPWAGEALTPDGTERIARQKGATVMVDNFPPDEGQRHVGLEYFEKKGFDWCLIVDADEFYTKVDIEKILKYLKKADKDVYKSERMYVYFKDPDYIALRYDGHHGPPVIAMRPHVRFRHIRDIDYPDYFIPETTLYHLSYIRTNEELLKKIGSWGHSHEIIPGWYENVWLKWTPEMMNFHPTEPNIFYKSVVEVLPYEIRRRLKF